LKDDVAVQRKPPTPLRNLTLWTMKPDRMTTVGRRVEQHRLPARLLQRKARSAGSEHNNRRRASQPASQPAERY